MDSDTTTYQQIDNLTEIDFNKIIKKQLNKSITELEIALDTLKLKKNALSVKTILLEERVEMLQKQVNYLQLVIRKYGKENKS